MNNTNPFVPQGSLLEQQSKRRSRLKLAVFCVLTVSVTGLAVMLIQGCKREQPVETDMTTPTIDTNLLTSADTNAPAVDTNAPVVVPPVVVTPPVFVPSVEPAGAEYVVVKADTLDKIAKKNHVTVKALEAANPGVVPTKLKIGQKLVVPGGATAPAAAGVDATVGNSGGETTYVVKSGDSLTKIAKAHGTTVKAIQTANNLTTTSIKAGQKLKIVAKATVAAPAPVVEPAPAVTTPALPVTLPATLPAK